MNTWFRVNKIIVTFSLTALLVGSIARADWEVGTSVPDLEAFELSGEVPTLEGKVTYLDFWASWCAPCKKSFPSMEKMYQKYKDKGFQVVAVSVDGNRKAMETFIKQVKPSFAVIHDAKQSLVEDTGLEVMPTSYLVDASGAIRAVHLGWDSDKSEAKLESEIKELLEEMAQ